MSEVVTSIDYHGKKLTLKAGRLAPQADMAVLASLEGTTVLATVVSGVNEVDPGYLPLMVRYEEKMYAGGIVPGGKWNKREGRPSDENVVAGRLVEHAIRYLFPKDFRDEVQLVLTVMSVDKKSDPTLLALIAASAVLTASPLPFAGPISSMHVGYKEGKMLPNPTMEESETSDLHLMISYIENERVQAMEASANLVTEEVLKEAIKYGFESSKGLFKFINDFAKQIGKKKREYISFSSSEGIYKEVKAKFDSDINKLVSSPKNKEDFWAAFDLIRKNALEEIEGKHSEEEDFDPKEVGYAVDKLQQINLRNLALDKNMRIDGRKLDEVRKISGEVNVLPQVHGSALFERGLTQGLSVVTLGSPANTLHADTIFGESDSRYFHHYVGLGFSTGEPSRLGGVGNREIGHGLLAQKALIPVLPDVSEFPYVVRVVSEILSQNGSSSMAATCGSTLALMDAGVPIKGMVGGISIGLISNDEETDYRILTDIQGAEDFAGLMDFKMTGTDKGVTAIQMDIKPKGIPLNLFDQIIDKSKTARLSILEEMKKIIANPNKDLKDNAPRVKEVTIKKDQIGLIIGPGGKNIKEIEAVSGASLDIIERELDASVIIMSDNKEALEIALNRVRGMVEEPEVGKIYEGPVTKLFAFGALVEFLPQKEGLVHVSEISDEYVEDINQHFKEGQVVRVLLKEIGNDGKYTLTLKFKE